MNVTDALRDRARERPHAAALVRPGGAPVGWRDFDRLLDAWARRFAAMGIAPGEVVMLAIRRPVLLLIAQLALMRMGAAALAPTQRHALARSCLTDTETPTPIHPNTRPIGDVAGDVESRPFESWQDPDGCAIVCPSSGTNGITKAIPITHAQLAARLATADAGVPLYPSPRHLLVGSLTGYGILSALRVLRAGGTLVFAESNDAVLATIERQRVDRIALMPWSIQHLVDARGASAGPLASLRQVEIGGEFTPAPIYRLTRERLCEEIWSVYGATECGSIAVGRIDEGTIALGDTGPVLPGIDACAFDEGGEPLAPGDDGTIRVRGAGIATGYLGDGAMSAATFRDGWFATGDIGRIDPGGRVRLAGRSGELVNAGGLKVAFRTVEDAVRTIGAVADAAAFGVTSASGIAHVGVAIVPRGKIERGALESAIRDKLPGFTPTLVIAVRELPRSAGGKVRRARLAELAQASGFGAPAPAE